MSICCIICSEELGSNNDDDIVNIGDKGKNTLILASISRGDGLQEKIEKSSPLKIHQSCRRKYTRPSTIIADKRRASTGKTKDEQGKKLRSSDSTFDIRYDCMFCTESIAADERLPKSRKRAVSKVETLEFKDSVLNCINNIDDEWGKSVAVRIQHHLDLVAAEAKYHRDCAQAFFKRSERSSIGKPKNEAQEEAFRKLCDFLDQNDESQYSLVDILEKMESFLEGEEGYTMKFLKEKLKKHYKDDIIITNQKGKPAIACFRDSTYRIIQERFKSTTDQRSEIDKVIDTAASIIRNDIRLKVYDCGEYPTMDSSDNFEDFIPETLKRFLQSLILSKKKDCTVTKRRCTAIAHSIISTCRPRSFVSPLLLAIAVYIHKNYASRELIDILSSMNFSDDYTEVQRLEQALLSEEEPSYNLSGFKQFVFDNADFNVATISGHNTFHSMGGIACVTPPGTVKRSSIKRTLKLKTAEIIGSFGQIPVVTYRRPINSGLQSLMIRSLRNTEGNKEVRMAAALDSLWVIGYTMQVPFCPSWTGFMQVAMGSPQFNTSRVEILPFINLNPNNLSTIYTALQFAQRQCKKLGFKICPVTFDQPLYMKAVEITGAAEDLDKIIVRLGGFHLLMSYLGCIGYIMCGNNCITISILLKS